MENYNFPIEEETMISLCVTFIPIILPLIFCESGNTYKILFWILLLELICIVLYVNYKISTCKYVAFITQRNNGELDVKVNKNLSDIKINIMKNENEKTSQKETLKLLVEDKNTVDIYSVDNKESNSTTTTTTTTTNNNSSNDNKIYPENGS